MSQSPLQGLAVQMGGGVRIVPPLTLRLLRKHAPTLKKIQEASQDVSGADAMGMFDLQAEVVFDAMQLNYPDLTQDAFEQLIDMVNVQAAFPAALGNLAAAQEAQEKNAIAVSRSGSLTGTNTPHASPHGQAGALAQSGP